MALMLAPSPWFTALDANGAPIVGAKVYTLRAGGTWPGDALATFSDADGLVPNANPVVCDAAGRCRMRLQATPYKIIFADADGVTIRTEDNVIPPSAYDANVDIDGVAGEALSALDVVYLSEGVGGTTAGRWYKTDSDLAYASVDAGLVGVVPAAVSSAATGAVRLQGRLTGYIGLTPGAKYYVSATAGGITAVAPGNERLVGVADSSTSLVIQPTYTDARDATARSRAVVMAVLFGR